MVGQRHAFIQHNPDSRHVSASLREAIDGPIRAVLGVLGGHPRELGTPTLVELTLVAEQVSQLNATVATGFGKADLAGFQQLDQHRPGYAQQIDCLLGGQQLAKRLQRHRFARTERRDCPDYDVAKLCGQMEGLARLIHQRELGIAALSVEELDRNFGDGRISSAPATLSRHIQRVRGIEVAPRVLQDAFGGTHPDRGRIGSSTQPFVVVVVADVAQSDRFHLAGHCRHRVHLAVAFWRLPRSGNDPTGPNHLDDLARSLRAVVVAAPAGVTHGQHDRRPGLQWSDAYGQAEAVRTALEGEVAADHNSDRGIVDRIAKISDEQNRVSLAGSDGRPTGVICCLDRVTTVNAAALTRAP